MPEKYDVVVVGARCAGSPLAADLAARGLRVCVLDRARFPSEVPSTHMLHPSGVARLWRLGLRDDLEATGAPPLDNGAFAVDGVSLRFEPDVAARFEAPWLCIRRGVLDLLLVQAAERAGVDVRPGTRVVGLMEEDGVVCGVRTPDAVVRASLVVGADGPHSAVARMAGASPYHVTPPGRLFLWAYYEGAVVAEGRAVLGRHGDIGYLAMPTDGGLFMAGVALPMDTRTCVLADLEASFATAVSSIDEVSDALGPAVRVGRIRTMTKWNGLFRQATGPGWVLVGDAGHFKDPTPAQGIGDALRQSETLAAVIARGLGAGGLDAELRAWWRWRDEDAWEMYWFAQDMGAPGRAGEFFKEMLRELGCDARGTELFLRALNHELPPSKVFTPWRGVRTLSRLAVKRPRACPAAFSEAAASFRNESRRRRLRHQPVVDVPG
jgi:menaquinone-9 beta-reductase